MKRTIVNPMFKDVITFVNTSAQSNGQVSAMELTLQSTGNIPSLCNWLQCQETVSLCFLLCSAFSDGTEW